MVQTIVRTIEVIEPFEFPVNGPPNIINETKETMRNTAVSGDPVAVDLEMDPLYFEVDSNPSHGTVIVNVDGSWTYTPEANYVGTDTFTVFALTGEGGDEYLSTIKIIINPEPKPDPKPTRDPEPYTPPNPASAPTPKATPKPPVVQPPKLEYDLHFDYIIGYPDGTFAPERPITRAEFATIASRFDKLDERTNDLFTDISGHWAERYIASSANKGWINGYADKTFRPDQYITRAEAMTLINSVLDRHVQTKDIHKDAKQWPDNKPEQWYYRDVLEATNYHDYSKKDKETEIWLKILPHRVYP
ncbi:S-layer homology domain-containing protein [Paenibacillus sp. FA6]|uniref:S-layer homology domain-containing protein n=1 Tax=Paenibacillus sp. FA6 TaxID=3413029 RepID=UPI003F656AC4